MFKVLLFIFIFAAHSLIAKDLTTSKDNDSLNYATIRNDIFRFQHKPNFFQEKHHLALSPPTNSKDTNRSWVNIGLGLGLDYGGYGLNLSVLPTKDIGIFFGIGRSIIKFGYNFGVSFKTLPDNTFCPYIGVMYGTNAVIKIKGTSKYDQMYYGPTIHVGFEIKTGKRRKNHFNFEFLYPIRSSEYYDDVNKILKNPSITIYMMPLPILISLGYHFAL